MASIRANWRNVTALALLGAAAQPQGAMAEVITELAPFRYDTERPEVLELVGEITHRTAVLFKLALADYPAITTLSLSSEGGSVYAALPAAYDVRAAGLMTTIPDGATCASACSYLFFAGVDRSAEGRLGVHQIATSTDSLSDGQVALGDIFKSFEDFGVPTSVISRMMRTPANSMYLFDPAEMDELGLLGPDEAPTPAPGPEPQPRPVEETELASGNGGDAAPAPDPAPQPPNQTPPEPEPAPQPVEPTEETELAALDDAAPAVPGTEDTEGLGSETNALDPLVAACFDAALPWANDFGWPGIRSKQIATTTAIAKCETARSQAPENVWVSISLARALGEAGQDARAVALYEPIAAGGNIYAKGSLGVFYLNGRGVGKNQNTAYRLFVEAAAQGNAVSHFALAVINAFPSHTVANDTRAAIDHAFEAIAAGEDRAPQIYRDLHKFPHAVRVGVQRRLQHEGFYSGALDGSFGPASWAAARLLALSRQAEG